MSCGVGHRCGSAPVLLWLWCRLAGEALIRPLAWEPPYATGVALKSQYICVSVCVCVHTYAQTHTHLWSNSSQERGIVL